MVKSFVTLDMVANLNTILIYRGILTIENVGSAVNSLSIFKTLATGQHFYLILITHPLLIISGIK